jgi:hypothetical protein
MEQIGLVFHVNGVVLTFESHTTVTPQPLPGFDERRTESLHVLGQLVVTGAGQ